MKAGALLGAVSGLAVALAVACGATPTQIVNDETLALDLTQAACSAADATGNPLVEVTCAIAQVAEDGTISITKLLVGVPSAQVAAFVANAPGARLVTRAMLRPFVSPITPGRRSP